MQTAETKAQANKLKAIAHPCRLQIVTLLTAGEQNVTSLNQSVKVSQPALSQHLSKLRRAGLVGTRREQREIFYYLDNPHVIRLIGVAREMAAA